MKIFLVVTYMAFGGQLHVTKYEMPSMFECSTKGRAISANVTAGKVSTVCWKGQA